MEKTPILRVDENYKRGLENGMQHAFLDIYQTNSPLPDEKSTCSSYVAGFEQGLHTAKRVLSDTQIHSGSILNMNIGGDSSSEDSSEEDPLGKKRVLGPPTAFLEDETGIPVDYCNPIESNSLESSLLSESSHGLTLLHYVRNGYAVYLKWFKDKAHIAGLSSGWDDYLTFSVARDINRYAAARNGSSPMGKDIEMIGYVHSLPPEEKDKLFVDIRNYSSEKKEMREALTKLPSMTTMDFYVRLKNVSEDVLDGHSGSIWRGTIGIIETSNLDISVEDLEMGKPMAPACGFHLGLRMLEINGFISASSFSAQRNSNPGENQQRTTSRSIRFFSSLSEE